MTDKYLSAAEAGRLLLVPLDAVMRWIESGRLLSHLRPDGPDPGVLRSELEAFVVANGMPPLPPEGSPDRVDQFLAELPADLGAALRAEFPHANLDLPVDPREALRAEFEREWPGTSGSGADQGASADRPCE